MTSGLIKIYRGTLLLAATNACSVQFVGVSLVGSTHTAEMLLLQLFFVYISVHISTATINKRDINLGFEAPQLNFNAIENLVQNPEQQTVTPTVINSQPGTLPPSVLILQVSTTVPPTRVTLPPSIIGTELPNTVVTQPNPTNNDCKCVPYYICGENKTILDNGAGVIDIRFAGPCGHYLEVCCNERTTSTSTSTLEPITQRPVQKSTTCGERNFNGINFRITGNKENEANYGEFPWMVAILKKELTVNGVSQLSLYQCGGSLIHQQVVLTAAHCVSGVDLKNLKARAGEWDTQTTNERYTHQDRDVKEVVIHENFYAAGLQNDIALLILENPFDGDKHINTICLPDEGEVMDGRECAATGWGKDVFGKQGRHQVIMKSIELPVVPRALCVEELRKTRLTEYFKLHESFICAGGVPGKDTCTGDGGGPLVCPSRDNRKIYKQAGIVAWGIGCGTTTPGVYVNVPLFRGWIDTKLSAYGIFL